MKHRTFHKNPLIFTFMVLLCFCLKTSGANEFFPLFDSLSNQPAQKAPLVIAVLPFSIRGEGISMDEGRVVAEYGIQFFVAHKNYIVVERAQLKKVIEEQELANSDLVIQDNAVKMGKLLSANLLVTGSVSKAFDKYLVHAKMINSETGKIISTSSFDIRQGRWEKLKNALFAERIQISSSIYRSAVAPGWGQFYSGKPIRGAVSLASCVGALGLTLYSIVKVADAVQSYNGHVETRDHKSMVIAEWELREDELWTASRDKLSNAVVVGSITAGLWILNIIDAGIAGYQSKKQFQLYFTANAQNQKIQLAYSF